MKKSALILSMLVVVSSAAPVVAMDNEQSRQSQQSRATQAINNLLRLDRLNSAFRRVGQAWGAFSEWINGINTLVGDSKKQNQNSIPNVFTGMVQEVQDGLRNANIPGLGEVVNDDRMGLTRLFCTCVVGYIFLKAIMNMNIFSAAQPQTTNQQ